MAAGLAHEDARFVARMLRSEGYYLVRESDIGWPQINAFKAVLRDGQDVREDAGGFFARSIMTLLGMRPDPVLTYRAAVRALLNNEDVLEIRDLPLIEETPDDA